MAELLVRVKDRVSHDFYCNCQFTKRGDVVVICPDGWSWGKEELIHDFWRIIALPNVPVENLTGLLAHEPETDPQNPSKTLQIRAFKLDLDNLDKTKKYQDYLADDSRNQGVYVVSKSLADIRSHIILKQSVEDPAIFGLSPNIF